MIEERHEQIRTLISLGKERGYLLYDEVNDILPPEVQSAEEIDELLSTVERNGIAVYEDEATAQTARAPRRWKWTSGPSPTIVPRKTKSSLT